MYAALLAVSCCNPGKTPISFQQRRWLPSHPCSTRSTKLSATQNTRLILNPAQNFLCRVIVWPSNLPNNTRHFWPGAIQSLPRGLLPQCLRPNKQGELILIGNQLSSILFNSLEFRLHFQIKRKTSAAHRSNKKLQRWNAVFPSLCCFHRTTRRLKRVLH